MSHSPESHKCGGRWRPVTAGEAGTAPAPDPDTPPSRIEVLRLTELHRPALTTLLEREPGHSLFLSARLSRFSLDASLARSWGMFLHHQLLAALMLAGGRALPYALSGVDITPLARLAAGEGFDFTLGRADVVDALLAACPPDWVVRREEHYLATLNQPQACLLRVVSPLGALVRRADPRDLDQLARLYLGADGFEGLSSDQLRQVLSGRVHALRTYVAELRGHLISAASTSAEAPAAAMIGGVWTAPQARNRGLSTAVVAALCRELLAEGRHPYLFYRQDNAPAAALYAKVGFHVAGHWSVASLSNRVPA